MLNKIHIESLCAETLQPRHFDVLGISLRQFHLWLKQTGLEKKEEQDGKWRLFSPVDLLALSTLKTLKIETDLSLSKHPDLIAFLSNAEGYALNVLAAWSEGKDLSLVTDFRNAHEISQSGRIEPGFKDADTANKFKNSVLTVSMPLKSQIQTVINAVKIGGSDRQRMTFEQLIENRASSLSKPTQLGPIVKSRNSPSVRKRGKRKVQL